MVFCRNSEETTTDESVAESHSTVIVNRIVTAGNSVLRCLREDNTNYKKWNWESAPPYQFDCYTHHVPVLKVNMSYVTCSIAVHWFCSLNFNVNRKRLPKMVPWQTWRTPTVCISDSWMLCAMCCSCLMHIVVLWMVDIVWPVNTFFVFYAFVSKAINTQHLNETMLFPYFQFCRNVRSNNGELGNCKSF